ncbi:MAG: hypothetical protein PF961_03445 [Planctomycetota bacterium]|nr:hypothetical protein [Planctomycetota bacterium]
MITSLLSCAALCLGNASLSHASAAEDAMSAAKALHREALSQADIWTCLQLEAWAEREGKRLGPALGRASMVFGDPLLAFPDSVAGSHDLGDRIVVVAGRRAHQIDADGRPLALPIRLPLDASHSGISASGRYLGVANLIGESNNRIVHMAVVDLDKNRLLWQRQHPVGTTPVGVNKYIDDAPIVSDDGSACAVPINHYIGHERNEILFVGSKTECFPLVNTYRPMAIGPKGNWILANHRLLDKGAGWFRRDQLEMEAKLDLGRIAAGGGIGIIRNGNKLMRIEADGTGEPWRPSGLEKKERLEGIYQVGNYLVVHINRTIDSEQLGAAADSVDLFAAVEAEPAAAGADLLGAPAAETPPSGSALLYRWSDLAKNPKAKPVYQIADAPCQADSHGPALWLWQGTQLDLLNLSGDTPIRTPMATMPAAITSIQSSHHHYVARLADDSGVVFDHQGTILWHGPLKGQHIVVKTHRHALRYTGGDTDYSFLRLASDPAQRSEVALDFPADSSHWRAQVDPNSERLVVGGREDWVELSTETGKVIGTAGVGPAAVPRPYPEGVEGEADNTGRLFQPWRYAPRLTPIAKPDDAAAEHNWQLADATLLGRTGLLLDARGEVFAQDRKGSWQSLGAVPGATRFCDAIGEPGLFVADRHLNLLGTIRPGPKVEPSAGGLRAQERNDGNWQIRGWDFTVPGQARPVRWDAGKVGFAPDRLVGIERSHLLVVTPSLVLALDPRAARAMAVSLDEIEKQRKEREAREARAAQPRSRR